MSKIQYYLTRSQLNELRGYGETRSRKWEAGAEFWRLLGVIEQQRIEFQKMTAIAMMRPPVFQVRCYDGADHIWDFRQRSPDGAAERYCTKCGAVS
jgi:hypothetical protein